MVQLELSLDGSELISDPYFALFFFGLSYNREVILYALLRVICQTANLTHSCRWPGSNRSINQSLLEKSGHNSKTESPETELEGVLAANDGSGVLEDDEEDLQRSLPLSHQEIGMDTEDGEADLGKAIRLSLQGSPEIYLKVLHRHQVWKRSPLWEQQQQDPPGQLPHPLEMLTLSPGAPGSGPGDVMREEDMLWAVVSMSLETWK